MLFRINCSLIKLKVQLLIFILYHCLIYALIYYELTLVYISFAITNLFKILWFHFDYKSDFHMKRIKIMTIISRRRCITKIEAFQMFSIKWDKLIKIIHTINVYVINILLKTNDDKLKWVFLITLDRFILLLQNESYDKFSAFRNCIFSIFKILFPST